MESEQEKKISAGLSADEIASSALSQLVGEVEAAIGPGRRGHRQGPRDGA